MNKFYTIFTQVGAAKLANATALGTHVELTTMAVGDGDGQLPTPSEKQTALVHEVRRAPLNSVRIDDKNPNWIICEQVIPENVGGWMIREVGLFDKDNDLIAVGNFPETYKPVVSENSGRTQTIRVVLEVNSTESMELKIDPSVVLATREYVDNQIKKATPKQLSATTQDVVDETGHTHALDMASDADVQAGTGNGIVSASQVADALEQFGLFGKNEQLKAGFDLNTLTATGFYDVEGPKNSPTSAGGWWHIMCQRHSNSDQYLLQFARRLDAGNVTTYTRTKYANKWSGWTIIWDADNLPKATDTEAQAGQGTGIINASQLKASSNEALASALKYADTGDKKATPKQLSATTKDVVDETGHTHALDMASDADVQALTGTSLINTSLLKSALYKRGLSDFSHRIDSGVDYNDLVNNGHYTIGPGNKNAPEATGWYYLTVNRHADPSHVWAIQAAVFMTKGASTDIRSPFEYVRVSTVSGWSPWYKRWNSFSLPKANDEEAKAGMSDAHWMSPNTTQAILDKYGLAGYTGAQVADFNRYNTTGFYNLPADATNSPINIKPTYGWYLQVISPKGGQSGFMVQYATSGDSDKSTYVRKMISGAWDNWSKLWDDKSVSNPASRYQMKLQAAGAISYLHIADLHNLGGEGESTFQCWLSGWGDYGSANRPLMFLSATCRGATPKLYVANIGPGAANGPSFYTYYNKDKGRIEIWAKTGPYYLSYTGNVAMIASSDATLVDQTGDLPSGAVQTYVDTPQIWDSSNHSKASSDVAKQGSDDIHWMTPLKTKLSIQQYLDENQPEKPGTIAYIAMSTPPIGWIKANGAKVSRTTYAALFKAIGTMFGKGDGSTTFQLPDLRGEFVRGVDDGRGVDKNRALGSNQQDEFKSHTHTFIYHDTFKGGDLAFPGSSAGNNHTETVSATGGTETRPRNVALLACIKY